MPLISQCFIIQGYYNEYNNNYNNYILVVLKNKTIFL
jgi:hypothetical protein